ncbi:MULTISPECIES: anthranilate synthase component II [unclassified Acetobacterium]|uniref:anthranilate synthase component II n=1 Tax=unclassified Acetobacterium TaxID=2638182 RepID=UPI0013A69A94|nr:MULTISPECIES: aminodeoxychorismate/anthranilate synthase component II [unclassified Acetobacterium]MDZ5724204.1 aminodeoxychorismate/anthranilate synthase component II [Acetobacterium sp. K1/6]
MILMIDNYDSFTYNLVQYLEKLNATVIVKRNDKITLDEIAAMAPSMIVLSPGPCTPNESGICLDVVHRFKGEIPILGICLGHQIIGQAFGCKIKKALEPVHGKVHAISHDNAGVFDGLNNPLKVTRYHSLVVENQEIPDFFEITARTDQNEIMGMRHKDYHIEGVQFHPEAILTEMGMELLDNFYQSTKENGVRC